MTGIAYYKTQQLYNADRSEVVPYGNDIMGNALTIGLDSDSEPTVFVVKVRGDEAYHAAIGGLAGTVFYGQTFGDAQAQALSELGSVFANRMHDQHFPDE